VEVLNEAYGQNIVIKGNELRSLRLNTTFTNESLDHILEVIQLTFKIHYTKTEDRILLY
jgi:transmembrane sensor